MGPGGQGVFAECDVARVIRAENPDSVALDAGIPEKVALADQAKVWT